ncbi:MAG: UbiA family prenyltransferase, partial [Bdellovibrionota bacterium]
MPAATLFNEKIRDVLDLSKSGIVTLVLIAGVAGYLMGQPLSAPLDWLNLIRTLTGILLLSSGSAALNQIQEQDLDARMKRTSARPLPSKRLTTTSAVTWSLGSTGLGLILLAFGAWQVTVLGALAMLLYNGMYTLWWKPKWAYAAVPGAIPGALP